MATLRDSKRPINYKGLDLPNSLPLSASTEDYLMAVMERIVFRPYMPEASPLDNLSLDAVNVPAGDTLQTAALDLVKAVARYQDMKKGGSRDFAEYAKLAERFENSANVATTGNAAPIMQILASNYMGLAALQLSYNENLDTNKKSEAKNKGLAAFEKVVSLATKHEDPAVPLWRGFALFNAARINPDPERALTQMDLAVDTRRQWLDAGIKPQHVQDGLINEYLYAAASLVKMDKTMPLDKVGKYGEEWLALKRDGVPPIKASAQLWQEIYSPTPGRHAEKAQAERATAEAGRVR